MKIYLLVLTFASLRAFAHDPYEITSTLSLYSNRTELRVEMEARTALLFAGHSASVTSDQIPALFTSLHDALTDTASRFLEFHAGDTELRPEKASLLLGVEDHLQFNLQFPRVRGQSIRCEPRVLQAFTNEGPYGISLTVLDMVNKKVLGQSVLFRDTPAADFASTLSPTLSSPQSAPPVVKIERSDLEAAVPSSASAFSKPSQVQSPSSAPTGAKLAPLFAAIAFLFVTASSLILFLRAKRKPYESANS